MPVRTDRGRVAVYRKLWGWPLRSPRHLVVTAVAVALLGGGVAVAVAAVEPEPAPIAAATSTTQPGLTLAPATTTSPAETSSTSTTPTSTTPTTTASTAPSNSAAAPSSTAADGTALAVIVAREFMARWVTHPAGMTSKQWAAQLAPYVVPEFVVELESVDPANVPATQVTGDPAVTAASPTIVEVDIPTDGGVVHLVLLAQPDRTWRIRSYDLAS